MFWISLRPFHKIELIHVSPIVADCVKRLADEVNGLYVRRDSFATNTNLVFCSFPCLPRSLQQATGKNRPHWASCSTFDFSRSCKSCFEHDIKMNGYPWRTSEANIDNNQIINMMVRNLSKINLRQVVRINIKGGTDSPFFIEENLREVGTMRRRL